MTHSKAMELSNRDCGTCTKCCEGYLSGAAHGFKFYYGKPCEFVVTGLGCTIYEDRPQHPCKNFKCHWITNIEVPEHFKPEISHIMPTRRGQRYIVLTNCGPNPNKEVIDWYKDDCIKNGYNIAYNIDGKDYFFGDPEFVAKMESGLWPS